MDYMEHIHIKLIYKNVICVILIIFIITTFDTLCISKLTFRITSELGTIQVGTLWMKTQAQ